MAGHPNNPNVEFEISETFDTKSGISRTNSVGIVICRENMIAISLVEC